MKRLFAVFALVAVTVVAIGQASAAEENRENTKVLGTDNFVADYTAPMLKETVRPDRVFYAPGREVEGYVTLAMLVDETGKVEEVKVEYRTSQMAVKNAVTAVNQWTFEPATVDDVPVKAWVAYNVPFGLDLDVYQETSYVQKVVATDTALALLR